MTVTRTNYDHLSLAELNDRIVSGEINLFDLPNWQISAWAAWEPDPLPMDSFNLSDPEQRTDFLYQYCYYGEPLLLAAVAHIWDSLAEPRELRCALIGQASGAGGTGKMALVLMLHKMLDECSRIGAVLPGSEEFDSLEERHQAVMAHFADGADQERTLCQAYGKILDGNSPGPDSRPEGKLIVGPWLLKSVPE